MFEDFLLFHTSNSVLYSVDGIEKRDLETRQKKGAPILLSFAVAHVRPGPIRSFVLMFGPVVYSMGSSLHARMVAKSTL